MVTCPAPPPGPATVACTTPWFSGEMSPNGRPVEQLPYSWDIVAGDLDGDGNTDVVLPLSDGTISVVLGRGLGRFAPPALYAVPTTSVDMALGDLDGNGSLDIAVVSIDYTNASGPGAVSVLLNRGDGTFLPAVSYLLSDSPGAVAIGDADHDGDRDLFVVSGLSGSGGGVRVLLNDGSGSFGSPILYSTRAGTELGTLMVAAVDVNGDGRTDIVAVNGSGTLAVLLGRANGFAGAALYTIGFAPRAFVVADFTGDGRPDVAVTLLAATFGGQPPVVAVLANRGNGQFGAATYYPLPDYANDIAAGDLDGDGDPDLVVPESNTSVLLNQGNGTFVGATRLVSFPGEAVVLTNLDGDGALDVLLGFRDKIVAFQGDGAGRVAAPATTPLGGHVSLRDVNSDGNLDLFGVTSATFGVALGNGDGTFQAPIAMTEAPAAYAVDDLDHDGKLDVVTIASAVTLPGTLKVWRGSGDGTFTLATTHATGVAPRVVATGDVNGDCRPDVIVAGVSVHGPGLYIPGTLDIFLNDGSGGLSLAWSREGSYWSLALGDFDSDGLVDVVTSNVFSPIEVLFSQGDGSFSAPKAIGSQTAVNHVVADVNADGNLDVLGPGVLLGDGLGNFAATPTALGRPVSAGDLDGDGHADIVAGRDVLFSRGDGTFVARAFAWLWRDYVDGVTNAIGDVTGDGLPDIITGQQLLLEQRCLP